MTQLAEYFAKIRFVIDKTEIKKVEAAFKDIEKKLKGSTKVLSEEVKAKKQSADVSKVKASAVEKEVKAVDKLTRAQEKLNKALSPAQVAKNRAGWLRSSRNIELKSGYGSQYRLGEQLNTRKAAELKQAKELADAEAKLKQKALEKERKAREQKERDSTKELIKLHAQALSDNRIFDADTKRRQQAEDKRRQTEQKLLERKERMERQREERFRASSSRNSRANYLSMGGGPAAFMRYGVASVPLIGGMYGMAQLNQSTQQLASQNLALNAVSGSPQQAQQYKEYLNNLGNSLGMTTASLTPGFTQYLASAQGTVLENSIQRDFESFTQYGAVMGLDPEAMKGSMKALTQMVSKQQIYAEELRGQLAERLPAAVKMMAQAVTGGDTKALIEMMAKGDLDPNKALPKFFEVMRSNSEPMMDEYRQSSRFAQGSMSKSLEDLTKFFISQGGEQHFARFFRTLTDGIKASEPLVKGLTDTFGDLVTATEVPTSLFKDLNDGLAELSKTTGLSESAFIKLAGLGTLMMSKWGRVAVMFGMIAAVLQDLSYGIQGKKSLTKNVMDYFDSVTTIPNGPIPPGNYTKIPLKTEGQTFMGLKGPLAEYLNEKMQGFAQMGQQIDQRQTAINDPKSIYYNDPAGYDDHVKQMVVAQQQEKAIQSTPVTNQNTFNMQFTVNGGTAEVETEFRTWARMGLQDMLNETMPNYVRSAQ